MEIAKELIIRDIELSDIQKISQINVNVWKSAYKGVIPVSYLDSINYQDNFQAWKKIFNNQGKDELFLVAELNSEVIGFVWAGPEREKGIKNQSELYAIYIKEINQRKGVGKKLFTIIFDEFQKREYQSMVLWTLKENPYRFFYESLGGELNSTKKEDFNGTKLFLSEYHWILMP
ncbi:hypothetical protein NEF87_003804 [Candidatus Lokiarchaeum ossiferum]|uniref:N-acetyltransferase domain-containing protein n=1 Tax=Candidatus Lokiarchaeum ossiferum TaxID=2951803 RepID=A0ABY6HYK3_9ARCH|nr:hypothetical protein NEF87_003804 [Candidatus Lokiarchaeum sp. B-35]